MSYPTLAGRGGKSLSTTQINEDIDEGTEELEPTMASIHLPAAASGEVGQSTTVATPTPVVSPSAQTSSKKRTKQRPGTLELLSTLR